MASMRAEALGGGQQKLSDLSRNVRAMAGLQEAIDAIARADSGELAEAELVERMAACRQAVNRLEAIYLRDLQVLDRRGLLAAEHGSTQAWLRAEAPGGPMDGRAAHAAVQLARDLADALPATAAALAAGQISAGHAQQIARLRRHASAESLLEVEPALVAAAAGSTVRELRDSVTLTISSLTPEQLAADERKAFERRELHASTSLEGVGYGSWTLDPVGHDRVVTALHAAATPMPAGADFRTPAQRRADALVSIAEFFLKFAAVEGALASEHGAAPQLSVLVPLGALTGAPGAPAAVTGLGTPISGRAARRLACDANITRIITGPRSEPIDVGRTRRSFTRAARLAIVARDRHCIWPGCTAPAAWCEAHHGVHWADGGPSDADNGFLVCGRHHDQIHHHLHAVVIEADGRRSIDLRCGSARLFGAVRDLRSRSDPHADRHSGVGLRQ